MLNFSKISILLIFALFSLSLSANGQVKVMPMKIQQRTLANGMKVVSLQDNSSPTVAIHVWYDVGGKNDPEGRSGFAHMFEHMMFKSTLNMPGEKLDRLTEDVGGNRRLSLSASAGCITAGALAGPGSPSCPVSVRCGRPARLMGSPCLAGVPSFVAGPKRNWIFRNDPAHDWIVRQR
jgi:hypothetical protein